MNYIEDLEHRYAVKVFDNQKTIPQDKLSNILKAGQLSPSSLGLQPYRVIVVESAEMKTKLIPAFKNPSQITTCSHLLVLTTKAKIEADYLNSYFNHISEVRNIPQEQLKLFRENIDGHLQSLSDENLLNWNEKQTYILLGDLIFAAALEKVDTCPIEGFYKDKMESILALDPSVERATVTLALGYRSETDPFQNLAKVRKPDNKFLTYL